MEYPIKIDDLGNEHDLSSGKWYTKYGKSAFLDGYINQLFLWAMFNSYVTNCQSVTVTSKDS